MKKISSILWGAVLVSAGIVFSLNAFDIVNISIFFDGWWTLFIIIPSFIGIFSNNNKTESIIGTLIGVLLLLCCQNVIDFEIFWKLILPVVIIIIGAKIILKAVLSNDKNEETIDETKNNEK